jgi:molybdopterin-containing oxidoreductase family membrane subunit
VIAGGLAQLYVIIIGGQAYPQQIFPGKDVSSSAFDGVVATYAPSPPEVALGLGGVGLALALTVIGLRALPFLPTKA